MSLTVDGTISRAELGLDPLPLNVLGQVRVVSYSSRAVGKVRGWARSPSMHGAVQTYSKKDVATVNLTLRFYASTKGSLDALIETYLEAFEQDRYDLSIVLNGQPTTWSCVDAEYRPVKTDESGDGVDKFSLMASPMRHAFAFVIPVQPTPTVGVF